VTAERAIRSSVARTAYVAAFIALSASSRRSPADTAAEALIGYERALHLAPQQQERGDASTPCPRPSRICSDGTTSCTKLPLHTTRSPADRAATSILVDNYGEAAAIDLYGPHTAYHRR